jgi:hypothetical protein
VLASDENCPGPNCKKKGEKRYNPEATLNDLDVAPTYTNVKCGWCQVRATHVAAERASGVHGGDGRGS